MRTKAPSYLAMVPILCLALVVGATSSAQESPQGAEYRGDNIFYMGVSTAVHSDISPPLRDIPPILGGPTKTDKDDPGPLTPCGPIDGVDPVAQTSIPKGAGEGPGAMPGPNVSFDAWANLCSGCAPPDPNGDVGPNHVVVMANSTIAVYSRTGTLLWGPSNINSLWSGFGGACQTENAGDPVVLYDQFADRWLVSQFTAAGPTYYNCVCLSTTADPTGTWQRYAFSNGTSFPDYPKYGIWGDGYYFSTRNTSGSTGQGAYALNRAQMLAGSLSPQVVNFLLSPGSTPYYGGDGLLPVDVDGDTLPPAGSPELFIGSMDNGGPYGAPQDALNIFQFHVDWGTPASSSFTRSATVPVAAFDSTFTPCGGGRSCIPQQGTTNKIDILSYRQRPIFRAAYRNFGDHESIVLSQSVSGYNSGTSSAIAGMRWYELRDPNGTPTIYQQGTYVPGATDGIHRWMGSVAMDHVGNMGLGFSASNASMYPSIWYTGRLAGDPLGTMPQGEGAIVNGAGAQTGGGSRWGDYTSLNVDPVDDCTFWYFNEYYTASSSSTWRMHVGSFTFPSCLCAVTPAAPTGVGASASADNQITVAWNDASAATITQYFVLRATAAGGPYTQIATVADTSPGVGGSGSYSYDDAPVSGGTRYYYVIRANDSASCTSANSSEVDALATGACLLAPTFAGLSSVANAQDATCTLDLTWSAGSSNCGGGSPTYAIYRHTASPVPIDVGHQIAAGVSGTSYSDSSSLASGTMYHYVVRAVDGASGVDDGNATERSGAPTGPGGGPFTSVNENFEGAWGTYGNNPPAGWTIEDHGDEATPTWNTNDWYRLSKGGTYGYIARVYYSPVENQNEWLITPAFDLPATASAANLEYDHYFYVYASNEYGYVDFMSDQTPSWANLATYSATTGTSTVYAHANVNLLPYLGQTNCKVRFRYVSRDGWYWELDNVKVSGTVNNPCSTGVSGPPGVPNGISGTAMKGTKTVADGSAITVTWDPGCAGTQYEIAYGTNGQIPASYGGTYGLTGVQCPIGATGTYAWSAPAIPGGSQFLWWLVVANDGASAEGSWGQNTGQERTGPGSGGSSQGTAGACATTKSLANTCGQ